MTRTSFAIGLVAAVLGIAPAAAADLSAFPAPMGFYPPPPVVRVYNWTGCYLGGQLGGAFANNQINGQFVTPIPVGGVGDLITPIANNAGATAVTLGGQGGCDLQVARNWVIGLQGDGVWTHLSGSQGITASTGLAVPGGGSATMSANALTQANILATATGRIGYAVNYDSIAGLFYLKGGAAFVNYNTYNITGNTAASVCNTIPPPRVVVRPSLHPISHSISMLRRLTSGAGQSAWARSGWLPAIGPCSANGII